MVKIENNIVYTINPYAYIPIENNDEEEPGITPPVLPVGIIVWKFRVQS
jgi:hypothetical protein